MPAPSSYGPVPSARQLAWHAMEQYGFVHFTVNTFTDKEWGFGDESPSIFNPTAFDADQIAEAARDGGLRGLVLTCKHHDGFCLWPSPLTEHSVKNSPWRNGRGDVVRELSDACRRAGLKFGVYLSPWDRNHAAYGQPEYVTYYRNQLRELLTGYGPLFAVWFDGANGGDGWYGGANDKRFIDKRTYYEWDQTWALVRELQPGAVMFSDGGPDIRWVGNERGIAGDPCWATLNRADFVPGEADTDRLNRGDRPGTHWLPAECDVSIRPGWFYHAAEDDGVRSPDNLIDLYMQSVGRGAALHLNLPPDRRGLIHERDVASLREFRRRLDRLFATNFAARATVTSDSPRGEDPAFAPANIRDGQPTSYWAPAEGATTPSLILDFGSPVTFSLVSLREFLPLGQRVESFALDAWQHGDWCEVGRGTAIGARRLVRLGPTLASRLRLRITQAPVCPAITELAVYAGDADGLSLSPTEVHGRLAVAPPRLSYHGGPVKPWQARLRRELKRLVGAWPAERVPLKPRHLWTRPHEFGTIEKLVFRSEAHADVPVYLCLPKNAQPPYPAMICLQGHSTGMHVSIAAQRADELQPMSVEGDRDFALGCMARGVAALCIEQRSFGERREQRQDQVSPQGCHDAVVHALLLGRTLVGERVYDVDRGIDFLETRPEIDSKRIGVMGNSGGGTTTIYAAALLPRLAFAMPSCAVCTFRDSLMAIYHCADNYVPGLMQVAEAGAVLALAAPKPMVVVAGQTDTIFPIGGVKKAFRETKAIYKAAGVADRCHLVVGPEGHRFYADLAWPVMLKEIERLQV